jgi:uncharacterized protein HemY
LQSGVGSRAFQNARLQKQFKKQAEVLLPAVVAAYRQGKQGDAQALCRQILKDLPDHFDALHLLGVSELDCGQFEEAERILARAVSAAISGSTFQPRNGAVQFEALRPTPANVRKKRSRSNRIFRPH